MKEFIREWKDMLRQKYYVVAAVVTAVLSYGYLWMHPAINVDDTSMVRYFYDGLAPQVGRWTLFVLNKVFHIAEFSPLVTDLIGVVLMAAGATVFCILLKRQSGNRLHPLVYPAFTCLMISYPMIYEVYTYYLHNGIGLAYFLTMLSLYITLEGKSWKAWIPAGVLFSAAISCYESFAGVYLTAMFLCLMARMTMQEEKLSFFTYVKTVIWQVIPVALGMVLRTVICRALLMILGLEPVMRSVGGSIRWMISPEAMTTLMTMVKTFARYYVLNSVANLSIALFLAAMVILVIYMITAAVKTRNWLVVLNGIAIMAAPWLISVIQGQIGIYRSMQALPILVAFCMILLMDGLLHRKKTWTCGLAVLLIGIVLYNQVFELNYWFYVDYLCYEEDVRRCNAIAMDLERETAGDKPVVFLGKWKESGILDEYAYVEEDTLAYGILSKVDAMFGSGNDEGEKKQYAIVQNPVWYPMFDWAVDAFDEPGTELIKFFRMHGHAIAMPEASMKEEAEKVAENMPVWPREGSVLETEDYIIVKLGE